MTTRIQDTRLFSAIRRGKHKPGVAQEFAQRVKAGALPQLTAIPGFRGYYLMFGADDSVMSITLFASKASAEEANRKVLPWIKENLGPLMASPPEPTEAEVFVHEMR